jgi:hypothetical protein
VVEAPPSDAHPSVVDEDKIVRDLSDSERAAWCAWYAPSDVEPGFPEPPAREPTAEGFYPEGGCTFTTVTGCTVNMPTGLPAAACEDNLALSSCAASVRDMNDCVLSVRNRTPSPTGCARYLDAGCSGTLLNGGPEGTVALWSPGESKNSCLVRVR